MRRLAEKNSIRNVPILAPRGKILDREGRIIVDNYPSFSALLLRDSSRDLNADADLIAQGLHLDANEVRTRIRHFASMPQYQPIFLKEDITQDEQAFIEAHRNELPELDTISADRRLYPRNGFMAHLIGYVGEVTEDMLNQPQFELYNPGDVVGVSGVERQYNNALMGKNGARQEVVNSHGREVGLLGETDAIPGKQLKLTIDIDLQIAAEEALEGKNGAIVAMDPHTGEILAMVSRPTFDPNDFAVRVSRDEWNKLVTDPDKPLLNKAIQAQLAPGSTFKIIMSVAGWQEGIAQDLHVNCTGGAEFYGRRFGCWVKSGHGAVNLEKAIYQSCDVFFYTLAEKLGIDRIARYATAFGLGQKTGIDLPNEVSGVMPSEEWKIRNFKQKWFAGETISVGIGQGAVAHHAGAIAARDFGNLDGWDAWWCRTWSIRKSCPADTSRPATLPKRRMFPSIRTDGLILPMRCRGFCCRKGRLPRRIFRELISRARQDRRRLSRWPRAPSSRIAKIWRRMDGSWDSRRGGIPTLLICVLFEGGEHGKLAARIATQVLKAYVDKQRRLPNKMVEKPKSDGKVDMGALWTAPEGDKLEGGRFVIWSCRRIRWRLATAAPGMHQG